MQAWLWIWTVSVIGAGLAFLIITLIVIFKGFRDLRQMFSQLKQQQN